MTWDAASDIAAMTDGAADAKEPLPDAETVARRLAAIPELAYEQVRETQAKALGVRVTVLDKAVAGFRSGTSTEAPTPFSDPEPWEGPVDGADLLDDFVATLERFCVLPEHAAEAIALWCLFAHSHDAAAISPLLALTSPEKRCGKTTTLSVISCLVPRAMHTINITPAVLFRVVERHCPTLLIDEGDTFLKDNDDLRGLLNGGHNRLSAMVWRSVGDDHEPRAFNVWAPKVIAMIGRLPDTLEDRSIPVPLRRRRDGETVERFRADRVQQFTPLLRKAARWSADNLKALGDADPDIPSDLTDRGQDNWRPLIAIADRAGGPWPAHARAAASGLIRSEGVGEEASPGVMLLKDVREIMGTWREISSTDLVAKLIELEDAPWCEWRGGKPITMRGVARLLLPFDVRPYRGKGYSRYMRANLEDAWTRYLASSAPERVPETCDNRDICDRDQPATEKANDFNDRSQVALDRTSGEGRGKNTSGVIFGPDDFA